jgi:hypothetical protein
MQEQKTGEWPSVARAILRSNIRHSSNASAMSIFVFRVAAVAQTAGEVANARLAAHALASVATLILSVDKVLFHPVPADDRAGR